MAIVFVEHEVKSKLSAKRKISAFLKTLVQQHRPELKRVDLQYIFCSDAYLLGINQSYLDHDTYTDIITFDLSETDTELFGEIYVSIDRVKENAEKFATSYELELYRVIFHGALHLSGFKDKKPSEAKEMRLQEDKAIAAYLKSLENEN